MNANGHTKPSPARGLRLVAWLVPFLVACTGAIPGETQPDASSPLPDGPSAIDGAGSTDGGTDATLDALVEAGSDATTLPTECASMTMGPAGGTLTHRLGASIVVPSGALAAATALSLCAEAATVPGALGQAFEASPEGQTFFQPVRVVLPFDPTRVTAGSDLSAIQMKMAPQGSMAFGALQSSVDLSAGLVSASTTHFTQYVPALTPTPVFITSAPTLPQANVGVAYSQQFYASGGTPPYAWSTPSSTSPPPGLALSGAGVLSGTPTIAGNFAFFVEVTDSASDSVEMAVSLTVVPPNNPAPTLIQVTPSSVAQGSGDTVITLSGTSFVPTAAALWDGTVLATTFVSATQLAATIPAADLLTAGSYQLSVYNPSPGGGTSGQVTFTVTPAVLNPVPSIASVSPMQLPVSSVDVQIEFTGSNFIPSSSVVILGSQEIATSYTSASQLLAVVPAAYLSNAGTLPMGVFNPAPGGGLCPIEVTIGALNPVPVLTTIAPSSVSPGSGAFTLSLSGSGFVQGAQAFFGSTALATTFVSATGAEAGVPGYLVASPGTVEIVLVNPTPGGGASQAVAFAIGAAVDGGEDGAADASQPGTCSAVPPSTAQADGGECLITLASGQFGPSAFAIDATNIYWVSINGNVNGLVESVPLGGGAVSTLASGQVQPSGIAVDATSVYWVDAVAETGTVMKVPIGGVPDGGAPTILVSGQNSPSSVAVDATSVYFTANSSVMKVPIGGVPDGGTPTTLATDASPNALVLDTTNVYFANGAEDAVMAVPISGVPEGGAPTILASGQTGVWGIAVDTARVYWTGNGAIMSAPLEPDGGAPTLLASGQDQARGIAVDSTSVYWVIYADVGDSVFKVPTEGVSENLCNWT